MLSSGSMRALGSYSGLENYLYRVEIHDAERTGKKKKPTFKWSRKNGSIAAKISKISDQSIVLEQNHVNIGGEFAAGDWVEVTDDLHELNQLPGTFVKIIDYDYPVIKFNAQNEIGKPVTEEHYQSKYNPIIRKWGSSPINIVLPHNEEDYIHLENGVKIQFSKGSYRTGDYWLIPCRINAGLMWEETNGISSFMEANGVEHHYCPLAIINKQGNRVKLVSDCRRFFHSLSDHYEILPV